MRRLTPSAFADDLAGLLDSLGPGERRLVAIAGAPGAGKSTLVERLETRFGASHPGRVAVLPMDGYHYDDELLNARGWRARKGAPHTFDVGGLKAMLERLKRNDEDEIAIPRFDREIEIARAGARTIPRKASLVLVEGNWLLLNEPPWDALAPLYDLTALIEVDEGELTRRLTERWIGFRLDADGIRAKLEDNDLPNGRKVMTASRVPHVTITVGP